MENFPVGEKNVGEYSGWRIVVGECSMENLPLENLPVTDLTLMNTIERMEDFLRFPSISLRLSLLPPDFVEMEKAEENYE